MCLVVCKGLGDHQNGKLCGLGWVLLCLGNREKCPESEIVNLVTSTFVFVFHTLNDSVLNASHAGGCL